MKIWSLNSVFVLILFLFSMMVILPISNASANENSWVQMATMHSGRGNLGLALVDGKIYAIGGSNLRVYYSFKDEATFGTSYSRPIGSSSGGVTGANEKYDPSTNNWTNETAMPTPRDSFAIAVCDGKIYCIGGLLTEGANVTGKNEMYDPATDSWETKAAMPTARSALQANVINGEIYCIGGATSNVGTASVNEVYDPKTDTWSTKAPVPTATSRYASVVLEGKIYILGGYPPADKLNQIYNPESDNWSLGVPLPLGGSGIATVTNDGFSPERIYVLSNNGFNQIYDPQNNSWSLGASLPIENLANFGIAAVDGKLYIMGGFLYTHVDNIFFPCDGQSPIGFTWQYTPVGYGTVPPILSVASPQSLNYTSGVVELSFTVDRAVGWMGYSLDGAANVTVVGNATLTDLANGHHNFTLYVNDTFGNFASQTVAFTVSKPAEFVAAVPAVAIVATVGVVGVAVGIATAVYLKKRRR